MTGLVLQRIGGVSERTWVALQRTGGALEGTGGAKDRTGGTLQRTGGALDSTGVVLQRIGGALYGQGRAAIVASSVDHPTGLFCRVKTEVQCRIQSSFEGKGLENVFKVALKLMLEQYWIITLSISNY